MQILLLSLGLLLTSFSLADAQNLGHSTPAADGCGDLPCSEMNVTPTPPSHNKMITSQQKEISQPDFYLCKTTDDCEIVQWPCPTSYLAINKNNDLAFTEWSKTQTQLPCSPVTDNIIKPTSACIQQSATCNHVGCTPVFGNTTCHVISSPEWLMGLINKEFPAGINTRVTPPQAKAVFHYSYKGQDVYFIPEKCCDIPSQLYDHGGKLLCEPSGGFAGHGDGRCPDFDQLKSHEELIWPQR